MLKKEQGGSPSGAGTEAQTTTLEQYPLKTDGEVFYFQRKGEEGGEGAATIRGPQKFEKQKRSVFPDKKGQKEKGKRRKNTGMGGKSIFPGGQ